MKKIKAKFSMMLAKGEKLVIDDLHTQKTTNSD